VASDAECLLRLAEDGTVSADNLKGLRVVSRVIELERTTDSSRDVGRALPSQGHFFDNLSIVLDQRTTPLSRFFFFKKKGGFESATKLDPTDTRSPSQY
jgi:hypothetical protein